MGKGKGGKGGAAAATDAGATEVSTQYTSTVVFYNILCVLSTAMKYFHLCGCGFFHFV